MRLTPDQPVGLPAFNLSDDQIATVVDLVCQGSRSAKADLTSGMKEVPISMVVRKAMRRHKEELGLTNLEVRGEVEMEDMATTDATVLGRIDITLKFLHQFGNEDAYVAIECKRVGAGQYKLNERYVTEGVNRFATAQYAKGHQYGLMLGYVLVLPVEKVVKTINARIQKDYGEEAALRKDLGHAAALCVMVGTLAQAGGSRIELRHLFVDMTVAA